MGRVYSGLEVSGFGLGGGKEIHRNDAESNKVAVFPPHKKSKKRAPFKIGDFLFLRKTKICFIVFLPEGDADVFPLRHKQKASCLCCHNLILNTRCPGVESPVLSLTKVQFLLCSHSSRPPHTGARGCVPFPVQSLAVSEL